MEIKPIQMYRLAICGLALAPLFAYANEDGPMTPGTDEQALSEQPAVAPYAAPSDVFVPESSIAKPGHEGRFAHTNYVIRNTRGVHPSTKLNDALEYLRQPAPEDNPQPDSTFAEYPASLACLYKMSSTQYAGCAPTNNSAYNAVGGARAIAIVDAYHYPTAAADLSYFNSFFGLPSNFTQVIANGNGACVTPPVDTGWNLEAALDLQWAHAMAPKAKLILVEACSNSYADLMYAEQIAEQQVLLSGGGEVSNSWGSGEWSTESSDWDWVFRSNWTSGKPIKFIFSAGDAGLGAQYPSSSPWVVSAGGTTINRDPTTQAFQSESCWAGSGGGTSAYELYTTTFGTGTGPWTDFQYPQFGQSARRTPDVAADADPASGAYVYYNNAWYVVGGTSLAAPLLAGITNNSNNRLGVAPSLGGYFTNAENNLLYAQLVTNKEYGKNFYDVTTGSNGASAAVGWDYCTGVGTPRGKLGK
jgi:subtilase family serine protease